MQALTYVQASKSTLELMLYAADGTHLHTYKIPAELLTLEATPQAWVLRTTLGPRPPKATNANSNKT